jgi:phenylacetate-CoA ligase
MASDFEERNKNETFPSLVTRYFSNKSYPDQMSLSRLAEFQAEALKEVISQAYENSPFYRQKMRDARVRPQDITSAADLARIPFTTKEDLRQNPWARLACDKKDLSHIHVSTGTTGGKEIYTPHTWREYSLNHSIIYPELVPVQPGDLCFVAMPYEMSQAGLNFHHNFIIGHRATVVPVGKGGAYSTPEKTVRLIYDLKPNILITSPSYAMILAEAAAKVSFDLKSLSLKKMWIGGEGCSSAFRKRIEAIWGTTVNFTFGSTECGFIGRECDQQNGYHLAQAHVLVEIVDPQTGQVLPPGQSGELVVTCLLRFDTPLIRYRTQDIGYLDPNPCSCRVSLQRLHLQGRGSEQIVVRGKAYSPFYLEELLMQLPEVGNWYQFVLQPGDNEQLQIRVEPAPGVEPSPELAQILGGKIQVASGITCQLEFVNQLPRTMKKALRVVRKGAE